MKDITSAENVADPFRQVVTLQLVLHGGKNNSISNAFHCPLSGCPLLQQDPLATPDSIHYLNQEALRIMGYPLIDKDSNIHDRLRNQPELSVFMNQRVLQVPPDKLTKQLKFGLSRSNLPSEYVEVVRVHGTRNTLLSDCRKAVLNNKMSQGMNDFVEFRVGHTSEGRKISSLHYMNEEMRTSVILGGLRSSNVSVREKVFVDDSSLEEKSNAKEVVKVMPVDSSSFSTNDPLKNESVGHCNMDLVWGEIKREYYRKKHRSSPSLRQVRHKIIKSFVVACNLERTAEYNGSNGFMKVFTVMLRRLLLQKSREEMVAIIETRVLSLMTKRVLKKRG